jgi:hypothetical protein
VAVVLARPKPTACAPALAMSSTAAKTDVILNVRCMPNGSKSYKRLYHAHSRLLDVHAGRKPRFFENGATFWRGERGDWFAMGVCPRGRPDTEKRPARVPPNGCVGASADVEQSRPARTPCEA